MTRRTFFATVASVAAAVVAPFRPKPTPLAFRADAFSSLKFIEQYDARHDDVVSRLDILYGAGTLEIHPPVILPTA